MRPLCFCSLELTPSHRLDYKTLRYTGHLDYVRFLMEGASARLIPACRVVRCAIGLTLLPCLSRGVGQT